MGLLLRILPPTIHPMVVHFPIAIAFLLLASEVLTVVRPKDPLYSRSGLILYVLELLSLIAAAIAGIVSEHAALPNRTVRPILEAHQRDAFLTGLAFSAAFAARALRWVAARRRKRPFAGPTRASFLFQFLGTAMLVVTANLGGSMVYAHGYGVAMAASTAAGGTSRAAKRPPPSSRADPTSAPQSTGQSTSPPTGATSETAAAHGGTSSGAAVIDQGRRVWIASCSSCHGSQGYGAAFVRRVGQQNLEQFISARMPPGNPLSASEAHAVVTFFLSH